VDTFDQSATYNWALAPGSYYKAGAAGQASDGTDMGVNMITLNAALGPADPLTITTTTLSSIRVGQPVSTSVYAELGTLPYTWDISAGALPAGISLNASTGALTGTPTTVETASFTVRVTDSLSITDTQALSWVVSPFVSQFSGGRTTSSGTIIK
jgi:hypothetical protein